MATATEDRYLGLGSNEDKLQPAKDLEESDSDSILSDDSVLPVYTPGRKDRSWTRSTLHSACAQNEVFFLRRVLERGVTKEEVMALDINGRNGLMVACCKGFVEVVHELHSCPFVNINHQDNEGNTALMIAAQAGHISTVLYLINYFPGIDLEVKDCRGFTALIKAAITGRSDVVSALVMAGADIQAVDSTKRKCAQEWALKTGRYETSNRMCRLNMRPKAEQFCESFIPEWPELNDRVAVATTEKSTREKIREFIRNTFGFRFPRDPEDNGVMDHMVRITTSLRSPLISTGCRPLCPSSPPEVGKRRMAVPELVEKYSKKELEEKSVSHRSDSVLHMMMHSAETITNSSCADTERRGSILSLASSKVANAFIPRGMARKNSVFPSGCIPQVSICRPTEATPKREKKKKKMERGFLEPPKWKYKDRKNEKREKAERDKKEKKDSKRKK